MACNATDIPGLSFPRNEIIEIIPASYQNEATRISIPGLPQESIAASPEDIQIVSTFLSFISYSRSATKHTSTLGTANSDMYLARTAKPSNKRCCDADGTRYT